MDNLWVRGIPNGEPLGERPWLSDAVSMLGTQQGCLGEHGKGVREIPIENQSAARLHLAAVGRILTFICVY